MTHEAWHPANDAELLMHHALLRHHTQRYFQLVAESTLYVPATNGRVLTWERDERPHVLVFTSVESVSRVVGAGADTVLPVGYPQLVRDWPDAAWGLALNPTLPLEATLSVTDVALAANGELDLEMPSPSVPRPPTLDDRPANEWEQRLADALSIGSSGLVLDLLVLADVLLPTLRPVTEVAFDDPYFPWAAMPLVPDLPVAEPAIGVFSSPERLADATLGGGGVPTVATPLLELARSWPGPDYTLLVNPHTSLEVRMPGPQVAGLAEWARVSALYYERVPE